MLLPPLLETAKSNTLSHERVPPQVGVESVGGWYQPHTDMSVPVCVKFGRLNDRPDAQFELGTLLVACKKWAAELPAHIPAPDTGGVAETVSEPSGLGALSAVRLAASKV